MKFPRQPPAMSRIIRRLTSPRTHPLQSRHPPLGSTPSPHPESVPTPWGFFVSEGFTLEGQP